jgi:hypothetical protein
MTSAINEGVIDETYPLAGQDNDTQGFRDNFGNIKTALGVAAGEITDLQNNSVLKASVDGLNAVVSNNMAGSTIRNGKLQGMALNVVADSSGDNTIYINASNASVYQITNIDSNTTVQFNQGWPSWSNAGNPSMISIKVLLKSKSGLGADPIITLGAGANTITADTSSAWYSTATPSLTFTLNHTTLKYKMIEAFSFDGGLNVYVRYLGEY